MKNVIRNLIKQWWVVLLITCHYSFAQETKSQLTTRFDVIRNETATGGNTKTRIANAYQELADGTLGVYPIEADGTDDYTGSLIGLETYAGKIFYIVFENTNTDEVTLGINSILADDVEKYESGWVSLEAGDIIEDRLYRLYHDGIRFQIDIGGSGVTIGEVMDSIENATDTLLVDPGGASEGDIMSYASGAPIWIPQNFWKLSGTSTLTGTTTIFSEGNPLVFDFDFGGNFRGFVFTSGRTELNDTELIRFNINNSFSYFYNDEIVLGAPLTIDGGSTDQLILDAGSFNTIINAPVPAANRTWTFADLGSDQTFVGITGSQALTNKSVNGVTLVSGGTSTLYLSQDGTYTTPVVGFTNLTQFESQTPWRVFYSDTDGDVTELALGADGTVLTSNGASVAPTFETPTGGVGDVTYSDIRNFRTVTSADSTLQGDQLKVIVVDSATPFNLRIDSLLVGTQISVENHGTATVTFTNGAGVTIVGETTIEAGESAYIFWVTNVAPIIRKAGSTHTYDIAEDGGITYTFGGDAGSVIKKSIAMFNNTSSSYSTAVIASASIPNNSIISVTVFVNGINSDGSEGYGGNVKATFRKTDAGSLVIIAASDPDFVEDVTGSMTIVLSESSGNVQLGVTLAAGTFNQSAWGEYTLTTY